MKVCTFLTLSFLGGFGLSTALTPTVVYLVRAAKWIRRVGGPR